MLSGRKILLVEDDDDAREIMTRRLERAGASVMVARNVAEAHLLIQAKPEMILLDLVLPDGFGWDLAREWKANQQYCSIPIIALTAELPKEAGPVLCRLCDAYHLKPVQFNTLILSMNRLFCDGESDVNGSPAGMLRNIETHLTETPA